MPRQRKIEPEAAVKATQALFWEYGYARLGTRNIEEKTGLTRFMLQTAHGGKRSLFLQVIDDYLDFVEKSFLPDVKVDSFQQLADWFESISDPDCLPDIFCNGCLMLNSIVEFNGTDPEFNQRTNRFLAMVRERFGTILRAAKLNSTSSIELDEDSKVEILMGLMFSMAVVIRASNSVIAARPLGKAASAMIRDWQ